MNRILLVVGVALLSLAGISFLGMISSFIVSILVGSNIIGSGGEYSWMRKFLGMDNLQWFGLLGGFFGACFLFGMPGALVLLWRDLRKHRPEHPLEF